MQNKASYAVNKAALAPKKKPAPKKTAAKKTAKKSESFLARVIFNTLMHA